MTHGKGGMILNQQETRDQLRQEFLGSVVSGALTLSTKESSRKSRQVQVGRGREREKERI